MRDLATGESEAVAVAGVCPNVGRVPNTAVLEGVLVLDADGRVPTDVWMRTALPGLFAVGDVRVGTAAQAITAAGDGATAAIAAHRYLASAQVLPPTPNSRRPGRRLQLARRASEVRLDDAGIMANDLG